MMEACLTVGGGASGARGGAGVCRGWAEFAAGERSVHSLRFSVFRVQDPGAGARGRGSGFGVQDGGGPGVRGGRCVYAGRLFRRWRGV